MSKCLVRTSIKIFVLSLLFYTYVHSFIFRFVVENTVEQKIVDLQKKKLQLADDVLSGAKRSTTNKLTLDDMMSLFDVKHVAEAPVKVD